MRARKLGTMVLIAVGAALGLWLFAAVLLPLLLPLFWGLDGIIYFMPLSDIITGVAALYVIISLCRRFKAPAAQSA